MQELSKSKFGYTLAQGLFKKRFEIPEDWEYPKFSDVVQVNPRTKIDSKKSFYIPMEAVNIQNGSVDNFEERNIDENPSLPKFQKNDVLFARITPSTENGKICIIEDFPDYGIASSELTVLRPSSKVLPRYLFYFVQSHRIKQYAISQMMGTTGRQRVPDRVFKKDLNFELPHINEQLKIIHIISNIHSLIQKTDQVIEQTQKLKKGLMQKLLTKGIGHTRFKKVRYVFGRSIEIPGNWKVVKVNDITQSIVPGRNKPRRFVGDIPWITISDLDSMYVNDSKNGLRVTKEEVKQNAGKIIPQQSVIMTCVGEFGIVGIASREMVLNQQPGGLVALG
jgi:type I restriction enzyme S subunit